MASLGCSTHVRPASFPKPHSANRHVCDGREQARLHQVRIELAHAACILSVAVFHELSKAEPFQKHIRLRYCEVPAIIGILTALHHAEEPPSGTAIESC